MVALFILLLIGCIVCFVQNKRKNNREVRLRSGPMRENNTIPKEPKLESSTMITLQNVNYEKVLEFSMKQSVAYSSAPKLQVLHGDETIYSNSDRDGGKRHALIISETRYDFYDDIINQEESNIYSTISEVKRENAYEFEDSYSMTEKRVSQNIYSEIELLKD